MLTNKIAYAGGFVTGFELFDEKYTRVIEKIRKLLPTKAQRRRAFETLRAIHNNPLNYINFRGRRMNYDRTIIRTEIGAYRMIFRDNGTLLEPIDLVSHQDYNKRFCKGRG